MIGPVRDVAYFDEVTSHGADIVDRIHGSHIDDSPSELTVLLAPALAAEGARRGAEAVRRANDAIGARATVGFTDIAVAAAEGRGHELIIEAGLTAEAAAADADPAAIDAVIDAVLAHNGNVMVVAPGSLREHGAHGAAALLSAVLGGRDEVPERGGDSVGETSLSATISGQATKPA